MGSVYEGVFAGLDISINNCKEIYDHQNGLMIGLGALNQASAERVID